MRSQSEHQHQLTGIVCPLVTPYSNSRFICPVLNALEILLIAFNLAFCLQAIKGVESAASFASIQASFFIQSEFAARAHLCTLLFPQKFSDGVVLVAYSGAIPCFKFADAFWDRSNEDCITILNSGLVSTIRQVSNTESNLQCTVSLAIRKSILRPVPVTDGGALYDERVFMEHALHLE